jgi:RNA polymerase sigma factor (sigma-70 family)
MLETIAGTGAGAALESGPHLGREPRGPAFPEREAQTTSDAGAVHVASTDAVPTAPPGGVPPTEGWSGLEQFRPMLERWLGRRCRDVNLAADVEQETLIRAARFPRPAGEGRQRAWMLRVASNVLHDHLRRRLRGPLIGLDDELANALVCRESAEASEFGEERFLIDGYDLDTDQARMRLDAAMRKIPASDRSLIESWYSCGGSSHATSLACGIPAQLIKTRLFRARRKLRKALRHEVARCWRP